MAAANAAQVLAVLAGLGVVWATRALPRPQHAAATMLAACGTMPYLWFYDWLPVMAAILVLMRPGEARPPAWLLAALWAAPLLSEAQEPFVAGIDYGIALHSTVLINVIEIAALWGTIGWLIVRADRDRPLVARLLARLAQAVRTPSIASGTSHASNHR